VLIADALFLFTGVQLEGVGTGGGQ